MLLFLLYFNSSSCCQSRCSQILVKALQNAKQGRRNLVLSLPYLCSTIPHRYEKPEGYNWLNVALLFGMTKNPTDMTSHFVMGSKLKVWSFGFCFGDHVKSSCDELQHTADLEDLASKVGRRESTFDSFLSPSPLLVPDSEVSQKQNIVDEGAMEAVHVLTTQVPFIAPCLIQGPLGAKVSV